MMVIYIQLFFSEPTDHKTILRADSSHHPWVIENIPLGQFQVLKPSVTQCKTVTEAYQKSQMSPSRATTDPERNSLFIDVTSGCRA